AHDVLAEVVRRVDLGEKAVVADRDGFGVEVGIPNREHHTHRLIEVVVEPATADRSAPTVREGVADLTEEPRLRELDRRLVEVREQPGRELGAAARALELVVVEAAKPRQRAAAGRHEAKLLIDALLLLVLASERDERRERLVETALEVEQQIGLVALANG